MQHWKSDFYKGVHVMKSLIISLAFLLPLYASAFSLIERELDCTGGKKLPLDGKITVGQSFEKDGTKNRPYIRTSGSYGYPKNGKIIWPLHQTSDDDSENKYTENKIRIYITDEYLFDEKLFFNIDDVQQMVDGKIDELLGNGEYWQRFEDKDEERGTYQVKCREIIKAESTKSKND